jgi:enoyl-CoA hydratase/carnithine racemase
MADEHVRYSIDEGAARLRLNRPEKRNAVSQDMWLAITAHLGEAASDPRVRGLVIEGLPGVFCAGADLTSVKHVDPDHAARYREIALESYTAIRDFPHPTLAAIDGLCIGGGCNIALACDVRFASTRANFAIPAVRHGIVYDEWTVHRLVELVGSGRASHFMFSAARIGVERAAQIGLVDVITDNLAAETASYLSALMLAKDPAVDGIRKHIHHAARTGGS